MKLWFLLSVFIIFVVQKSASLNNIQDLHLHFHGDYKSNNMETENGQDYKSNNMETENGQDYKSNNMETENGQEAQMFGRGASVQGDFMEQCDEIEDEPEEKLDKKFTDCTKDRDGKSLYDFQSEDIWKLQNISMSSFTGQVVLVVPVASF